MVHDIHLVPPEYSKLKDYQKIGFMVTRSGWSIHQAAYLLKKSGKFPARKLAELHILAEDLRKEVEEFFWLTHSSAWKERDEREID